MRRVTAENRQDFTVKTVYNGNCLGRKSVSVFKNVYVQSTDNY